MRKDSAGKGSSRGGNSIDKDPDVRGLRPLRPEAESKPDHRRTPQRPGGEAGPLGWDLCDPTGLPRGARVWSPALLLPSLKFLIFEQSSCSFLLPWALQIM